MPSQRYHSRRQYSQSQRLGHSDRPARLRSLAPFFSFVTIPDRLQLEFALVTLEIPDVIMCWRVLSSTYQIFFDAHPLKSLRRRNGVPQNSRRLYPGRVSPPAFIDMGIFSLTRSLASSPQKLSSSPIPFPSTHQSPPQAIQAHEYARRRGGRTTGCCPLHYLSSERGVLDWLRVRVVHGKLTALRITVGRS